MPNFNASRATEASGPQFSVVFNRTTEQGYQYNVFTDGNVGGVSVDPTSASPGRTYVVLALDIRKLELTNTSGGRLMDVGQDSLEIGGVGMVVAWPRHSPICDLLADQWAMPDGRCAGGFSELSLQDKSALAIPADEPQPLGLLSPTTGGTAVLAFNIADTASAKAKLEAALKNPALCVVAVRPGSHSPGVVRYAACSD